MKGKKTNKNITRFILKFHISHVERGMVNKKMKIIYGCNGEGRGHAARTAALWPELRQDLDITVWSPESIQSFLYEKCQDIRIRTIPGLHFSLQKHRVDYWGTIVMNMPLIGRFNKITDQMAREMKDNDIQGVISDFEPFTAVASAKAEIPLINLNHPAVVRRSFSILPDAVSAKAVASFMTPPAQKNLICSFYDGDVGPILRKEVRQAVPEKGDYILVYVKKSSADEIREILGDYPDREFHIFPGPDKDFVTSLAGCAGVLAPAGHQLLSEALFLKKPVLAIPQQGQYEQRLNARMLKASGWGRQTEMKRLREDLTAFLEDLPRFPFKADPFHTFRTGDDTEKTASIIRYFFTTETSGKKLSPRVSCSFFNYIPERIRKIRELTA